MDQIFVLYEPHKILFVLNEPYIFLIRDPDPGSRSGIQIINPDPDPGSRIQIRRDQDNGSQFQDLLHGLRTFS